jgi:DNA-directed RNA polymerase subunit M/transcription elongation factor TFIIS
MPGTSTVVVQAEAVKVIAMRLPWQPKEFERTCAECGYLWRVPRSASRRRIGSISMFSVATLRSVDRAELGREVRSASIANQPARALGQCPRCGAAKFAQRAVRGNSAN